MGGEILCSGWGVVVSWSGGRVRGGGMLGGECPTQFLSNRSQHVMVDGCRSKLVDVVS